MTIEPKGDVVPSSVCTDGPGPGRDEAGRHRTRPGHRRPWMAAPVAGLVGVVLTMGAVAVAPASGASGMAGASGTAGKGVATITIQNFHFSPMSLKVKPGQKVKVVNKDSVTHTLTSTTGKFTTGDIGGGKTKTFTAPKKAGTYHYLCMIHQFMMGTVIVS